MPPGGTRAIYFIARNPPFRLNLRKNLMIIHSAVIHQFSDYLTILRLFIHSAAYSTLQKIRAYDFHRSSEFLVFSDPHDATNRVLDVSANTIERYMIFSV